MEWGRMTKDHQSTTVSLSINNIANIKYQPRNCVSVKSLGLE